ncbi:MAG: hypothetical protein A2V74_10315 [Acidobacteria bacterium RBG_16_70_10]|nr:MAG: hypothetical protein A2V74_10315 [Acidobacteria bacterium RBG_16_70_10]
MGVQQAHQGGVEPRLSLDDRGEDGPRASIEPAAEAPAFRGRGGGPEDIQLAEVTADIGSELLRRW